MSSVRLLPVAAALAAITALAGCSGSSGTGSLAASPVGSAAPSTSVDASSAAASTPPAGLPAALSTYSKVLLVAMENKTEAQVYRNSRAPFLTSLADRYGRPAKLDAGYPAHCPSLAAYLLMTSGSTHGVCDDRNPKAHRITGPSLFSQLSTTGRQWRNYAEAMPQNCHDKNSKDMRYAVRHAPAVYYVDERDRCQEWQVPLGDLNAGALVDDLSAGQLPEFSFVSPDLCHDMHGSPACRGDDIRNGDDWIKALMARIEASPDWTSGRLVVVITWDEGTKTDNHIPAVIASPTTKGVVSQTPYTQCSVLRTVSEIVRVPPLGCAAQAPSMLAEFNLAQ